MGDVLQPAPHEALDGNDGVSRIDRLASSARRSRRRSRRPRGSGRSTAAAAALLVVDAPPRCRCAPSPPANWSCRGRCRSPVCARAAPPTHRVRQSETGPSLFFQRRQRVVDFVQEFFEKHQATHTIGGAIEVAGIVQQHFQFVVAALRCRYAGDCADARVRDGRRRCALPSPLPAIPSAPSGNRPASRCCSRPRHRGRPDAAGSLARASGFFRVW
jgi:hypothetical protein